MREHVTFTDARDARDYAALQDKLHGYPRRNVRVDGRPGTSFTERYSDVRKHPKRDEWAVDCTETPAELTREAARPARDKRLSAQERTSVTTEVATRKQLPDDWKPETAEAGAIPIGELSKS